MSQINFSNHSSVIVPRSERESIRAFYIGTLGGQLTREDPDRDILRLGDNFYIAFLYGDVPNVNDIGRQARFLWLELRSDEVPAMTEKILAAGVLKLDIPDPHLYFQAPGGQVWRLVGTDEDMSFYEGRGDGPDVNKVKQAINSK
ncbi:VOC family protein [Mucilaginibacter ximonensis]|uniref:VOC family protein n=1 Tax=Mucilaginibacter ximonensis TaxID=538021 RepID=A0ABW5Y9I6_9SPHI